MREEKSLLERHPQEVEGGEPIHRFVFDAEGELSVTGCERCMYCCWCPENGSLSVALTDDEIKNPQLKGKKHGFMHFKKGICPNLKETGCVLGQKRPYLCKSFPFLLQFNEIIVDTHCPAVKNYSLHGLAAIAEQVAQQYGSRGQAYLWRANLTTMSDEYNNLHTDVCLEPEGNGASNKTKRTPSDGEPDQSQGKRPHGRSVYSIKLDPAGGTLVSGCAHCKVCCTVTASKHISFALTDEEVRNANIKGVHGRFLAFQNECCPNLEGKGCTLGKERPFLCRAFPFLLKGDEIIVVHCPAIKHKPLYELVEMAKAVAQEYAKRGEEYLFRAQQAFLEQCTYFHTGISVINSLEPIVFPAGGTRR